ncbi:MULTISPECIES: NAD-dependent epimerase/dehydratase family protein [unclassified Aureimonas]|uniref:NAD-dependent epimerase/dehydratase family protein n=1 Tax=unclassified Aureimonas TaxID=2615206 RepID=UPI0006FDB6C6|nr:MULTISPECIES: NAD-dependent epimerase/dehydratase family protein [unclassified Aureimonas]KQT60246.1 dihydrofolate synthase [Aureimonas sp. Leaf427]KQT79120.1 dihydrofolate synthase [Aureimonas sp. Leaf460]
MAKDRVLVTGVSGFIAKHVAGLLLDSGFAVRGTVRSRDRADEARAVLIDGARDPSGLEIVDADLDRDDGWDEAMRCVRYVLHTASPFPAGTPRDRHALVPTAKGGALRVVAAADRAGVERLVLTSSVAAVYYGHEGRLDPRYTEANVSNVESPSISAYAISKTLAERAAWDAVSDSRLELATVNPALVLGPLADQRVGSSISLLRMMMQGRLPVVPDVNIGIVDVRDVAEAHLRAMLVPEAAGRRFLLSAGSRSLREIGRAVAKDFPDFRRRMPRATIPDGLVRIAARFVPLAASVAPELGVTKILDTTPAEELLGLRFHSPEEAIRATGEDLIRFGLVRR